MGSGKTFIMLNIISKHSKTHDNMLYLILCDRQEVLEKIFFKAGEVDKDKIKFFKDNEIIDLEQFDIINYINNKPNEIKYKVDKPTIMVINNAFLRNRDYMKLENIGLILLDECHCISGNEIYKIMRILKYEKKISIIGFSATPLRPRMEKRIIDIFSKSFDDNEIKELNIISSYDLISAIKDEIVLPFKYYYAQTNNVNRKIITFDNKDVIKKILIDIIPTLPYKKIIVWCRTISLMEKWYLWFLNEFSELKIYMTSSKDNNFLDKYNCNYDEYYNSKKNSVLIAVNRIKEGSDIPYLDCGIYLDAVKKRSIVVALQTGGRIIRPDKERKKTHGIIIDMFIMEPNKTIEMMTISKVIEYYSKILNLTNEKYENEHGSLNKIYEKMMELDDKTIINKEKKEIVIRVDENEKHNLIIKLELTTMEFDWSCIKPGLHNEMQEKFNIKDDDEFIRIIKKIKDNNIFNINSDFWKEYEEKREKYNLPKDLHNKYKEIFDKESWYELLGIDTGCWYNDYGTIRKALYEITKEHITEEIYNKCLDSNSKLPPYPKEFFKKKNFMAIEKHFNNNFMNVE
jgi:superfamily II DNA or RNA helicase